MSDLLLLHSFLETADAGGITAAARRLFVTQPALSRRLQQLEADLGVRLFELRSKGVALTEEGRLVAREARDRAPTPAARYRPAAPPDPFWAAAGVTF